MNIDTLAIRDAVVAAGTVCREIQAALVTADTLEKKDRSPVTLADFAAQAVICRMLATVCPEIPVVAEEDAEALRMPDQADMRRRLNQFLPDWSEADILAAIDHGNGTPGDLFFTLDPIDGTKGFLRGGQYAQALALVRGGEVVMGWLGCPGLDADVAATPGVILTAERGAGGRVNGFDGAPMGAPAMTPAEDGAPVRFLEGVESGHSNHGAQERVVAAFGEKGRIVRVDSQVKYALLAMGRAEVYLRLPSPSTPDYREKIWDHAAGALMVETAGGKVTDAWGHSLDFTCGRKLLNNSGIVAATAALHPQVMAELKKMRI